jgi:hypothetical protein
MRKLLLLLSVACAPAFAQCPAGFTPIQQTWRNDAGGLYAGTVTATRTDAATIGGDSVRPRPVTYTVIAGALNWCLAPGIYAISSTPNAPTLSVWTVPAGGPVTTGEIESSGPVPPVTKFAPSQLNPGLEGQVLITTGGVPTWGAATGGGIPTPPISGTYCLQSVGAVLSWGTCTSGSVTTFDAFSGLFDSASSSLFDSATD